MIEEALCQATGHVAAAPMRASPTAPPIANGVFLSSGVGRFEREGEYWTIGYNSRVVRLRDSKGVRVLGHLLAEPGRSHAALDLERLGSAGGDAIARAIASGDAGELLDDEARRAYRARSRGAARGNRGGGDLGQAGGERHPTGGAGLHHPRAEPRIRAGRATAARRIHCRACSVECHALGEVGDLAHLVSRRRSRNTSPGDDPHGNRVRIYARPTDTTRLARRDRKCSTHLTQTGTQVVPRRESRPPTSEWFCREDHQSANNH